MTDRPILFSAMMVRAIIEGRKTQTRRVLKPQPSERFVDALKYSRSGMAASLVRWNAGDRLWVREAWRTFVSLDDVAPRDLLTPARGAGVAFEAGGGMSVAKDRGRANIDFDLQVPRDPPNAWGRLRAAMHMPRWASRLTLIVEDVRVHRLQEINEVDAEAEGAPPVLVPPDGGGAPHVEGFRDLWDSINGSRQGCSWQDTPFVAAITFRAIKANIDSAEVVK